MTWHCKNVNLQLENYTLNSEALTFFTCLFLKHRSRVSYLHKYCTYYTLTSPTFCIQMRRTTLCSLVTSYSLLRCNLGSEGRLVIWLLASCSWFNYKSTNMCLRDLLRKLCVNLVLCGFGGVLSKQEEKAMECHTIALMATIAT